MTATAFFFSAVPTRGLPHKSGITEQRTTTLPSIFYRPTNHSDESMTTLPKVRSIDIHPVFHSRPIYSIPFPFVTKSLKDWNEPWFLMSYCPSGRKGIRIQYCFAISICLRPKKKSGNRKNNRISNYNHTTH